MEVLMKNISNNQKSKCHAIIHAASAAAAGVGAGLAQIPFALAPDGIDAPVDEDAEALFCERLAGADAFGRNGFGRSGRGTGGEERRGKRGERGDATERVCMVHDGSFAIGGPAWAADDFRMVLSIGCCHPIV